MHLHTCCSIFLIFVALMAIVRSDIFEECGDSTNRRFIASNRSCQHYIFCDGDNSYEGECGEGDYFNELFQTCDPQELVECGIGDNVITTLPSPTLATATTTTATSITAAAATTTTTTTRTTFGTATTIGTLLPSTINFSTTATPSALITTTIATNSSNATASPIIVSNKCPTVDNKLQMIFLAHPKSCSDYFVCFHGEAIPMHCSPMLHFDTQNGRCDYPENVKCQIEFTSPREQCHSYTVDLYPHPSNCNYFYSCSNGYLLLQQCPFFYGWDYEKRTCVRLNQAMCFNNRNHV